MKSLRGGVGEWWELITGSQKCDGSALDPMFFFWKVEAPLKMKKILSYWCKSCCMSSGRLGLGSQESFCIPQEVPIPADYKPSVVYCGVDSSMLLTLESELLCCGSNRSVCKSQIHTLLKPLQFCCHGSSYVTKRGWKWWGGFVLGGGSSCQLFLWADAIMYHTSIRLLCLIAETIS